MNFIRTSQWAELTDCNRYSVAASKQGERYVFTAWRLSGGREPAAVISSHDTPEEAREACRKHSGGYFDSPETVLASEGVEGLE